MSLCGACYLWSHGECTYYEEEGYEFEDNLCCDVFDLSDKAMKLLIKHKQELE